MSLAEAEPKIASAPAELTASTVRLSGGVTVGGVVSVHTVMLKVAVPVLPLESAAVTVVVPMGKVSPEWTSACEEVP